MFGSSSPPVVFRRSMFYFCYLYLFTYNGVQHILCCVVFLLCFSSSCVPYVVHLWLKLLPLLYSLTINWTDMSKQIKKCRHISDPNYLAILNKSFRQIMTLHDFQIIYNIVVWFSCSRSQQFQHVRAQNKIIIITLCLNNRVYVFCSHFWRKFSPISAE